MLLGDIEGSALGSDDGMLLGDIEGTALGSDDGIVLGSDEGSDDGTVLGAEVGQPAAHSKLAPVPADSCVYVQVQVALLLPAVDSL